MNRDRDSEADSSNREVAIILLQVSCNKEDALSVTVVLVKVGAVEGSRFVSEDMLLDAAWDARLKYFRVQIKRKGKAARATVRVIGAASS